jgi:hypothetical protein
MKNFPIPVQKILPALVVGAGLLVVFGSRHSSVAPVEASTTRNPVVAPAGTVLRVRMNQALDAGHSRPGDRFEGVLDVPVVVGGMELFVKGTPVHGHVVAAGQSGGRVVLALTLDSFELPGREVAISTSPVTRASGSRRLELSRLSLNTKGWKLANEGEQRVAVAAESIMGFTLTCTLAA